MFEFVGWIKRDEPAPVKDLPKLTPGVFRAMFA